MASDIDEPAEKRRQQYIALAEKAEAQASHTQGELRAGYLRLAQEWRKLAEEIKDRRWF